MEKTILIKVPEALDKKIQEFLKKKEKELFRKYSLTQMIVEAIIDKMNKK